MAGCNEILHPTGGANDEHVPFDIWKEVQIALRTSPDHLPARANHLVTKGDPEALFQFVRDEIVTYPDMVDRLSYSGDQIRWGVRGTLRGGAGTPREKAELLATLYRRAGWEADILTGDGLPDSDQVKRLLCRPVDRRFAPDIDNAQIGEWQDRLKQPKKESSAIEAIDKNGDESKHLGKRLYEQLPDEDLSPQEFDWDSGNLPIVRVVIDGTEHYADLFALNAAFGETRESIERLDEAPEASETLPVEVTLSAATADDPEEPVDLVSGSWSADELVGRQLLVQTLPGIDPFDQPTVTFQDVQTFIPALTVQGMDLNQEKMAGLSVMGDAVTRAGDQLHIEEDGTVLRNGEPFVAPDGGTGATAVSELRVSADSGRFPEIQLNVHALDDAGDPVEGLPAMAFEVEDGKDPVGVAVTANEQAPRVLILSDTSISMPSEYRNEGMEALVKTLRDKVVSEYPNAKVKQQYTSSDIWTSLGNSAGTDANLIVYATDGHVNDELTPEIETALRQGPPAVMLSVTDDLKDENLQQMASLTDGTLIAASDQTNAKDAIMDYLETLVTDLPTYVLTYGSPAPEDASGKRQVSVGITDSRANGRGSYLIPDSPALPPHFAGLYLTVTIGKQEVTRTLAGYDPVRHKNQPATQKMVDEVAGALFGNHMLAFEAAAPSFSVWFDDFLSAKLSVAELDKVLQDGDNKAVQQQKSVGIAALPPELFQLVAPLPDAVTDQSLTFQDGPRVVLHQQRPVFGADHIVRHADLLPFSGFATAADDPSEAFRLTLEQTARLAIVESALFETSTRSMLAGASLGEIGEIDREKWDDENWDKWDRLLDPYSGSDYQLLPENGAFDSVFGAFWNIDQNTGELMGILGDGSGGGTAKDGIRKQIKAIDRVVSMLNILVIGSGAAGIVTGPGALALGIVAAYGQTLARLYGAAALAIAIMDASKVNKQVDAALALLVCNVAKKITYALTGAWVIAMAENLLGLGAGNPLSCT
ncbi:hypothetical protein [Haladaptatus litoreus]|uniref:hypothetical protein n=1 Tax=Haladaptatus litoreus TaxID=553468 RepID=UPI0011155F1A|nr:hypothetical protein [Haladaptatus litoreus]